MPVDLNSFTSIANRVGGDTTILANQEQARSVGGFRSAIAFKSTHRASMEAFLGAFEAKYGGSVGRIARDFLANDIAAGRPLKANQIKMLVEYGEARTAASQAWQSSQLALDRGGELSTLLNALEASVVTPGQQLTTEQRAALKSFAVDAMPQLQRAAGKMDGDFATNLRTLISNGQSTLLKTGAEIIAGKSPYSTQPGSLADKLSVLSQLSVDGDITFAAPPKFGSAHKPLDIAMTSLRYIREHAGTGPIGRADILHGTFPPGSTGSMAMPGMAAMDIMTPAMFKGIFEEALLQFKANLNVDNLPPNSVFSYPSKPSIALVGLKTAEMRGMSPAFIYGNSTVYGREYTLADFPTVSHDITFEAKYASLDDAKSTACSDLARLNLVGARFSPTPPTVKFEHSDGVSEQFTVGTKAYADSDQSPDAVAYKGGKTGSKLTNDIFANAHKMSSSPRQEKALVGIMTQNGVYPMWHFLKCMGGHAAVSEHSNYSYAFKQNEDHSVDVTVTLSPELAAKNGTCRMTVHIPVDGDPAVTAFNWRPADAMPVIPSAADA